MNPNNPLQQYFRQPAIYVKLPSQGQFYPPGTLNPSVIQSCVPNIVDAWAVPAMDLDAILVAIRIASYGHEMEFGSTCPKCQANADRGIDLRQVMDTLRAPDYTDSIRSGDMEIFFRPMTYKNLTDNSKMQYENQKIIQMMPDLDVVDEQKVNMVSDALKKITEITVKALAMSIAVVKTPTAMVTETEFIEEMLLHCDRKLFNQIRDYAVKLKSVSEMQPLHLVCDECNHEYDQQLTLDMSSFFAPAS